VSVVEGLGLVGGEVIEVLMRSVVAEEVHPFAGGDLDSCEVLPGAVTPSVPESLIRDGPWAATVWAHR
jgi:hypothetical protein